jgi:AcrR family transcriptional regulator
VSTAEAADALTKSQAARRQRVLRAALELASEGGYDAVQMRDVATRADVALGTIYRYFTSKDHLLAAAMTEWVADLERRVNQRPAQGATTAARVMHVLRRALRAMDREPLLTSAVVSALCSGDEAAGQLLNEVTTIQARIMRPAFPDDIDEATELALSKVLGHVWWSCLVSMASGVGGIDWVESELDTAARLLLDSVD